MVLQHEFAALAPEADALDGERVVVPARECVRVTGQARIRCRGRVVHADRFAQDLRVTSRPSQTPPGVAFVRTTTAAPAWGTSVNAVA